MTIRDSCHNCQFTSPKREGDLTLADFWQYEAKKRCQRGSENGVGLAKVNTDKGKELLSMIREDIFCEASTMEIAHKSNQSFSQPWKKPDRKDAFWMDYKFLTFEEIVEKYCDDFSSDERRTKRIVFVRAHKYWLLFKMIDKFRGR